MGERLRCIFIPFKFVFILQVNDTSPTGTFLDRALFTKIAAERKKGCMRKLVAWTRDCITTWNYENNVPSVCLDSLVQQGILGKERKLAGMYTDYPTKNPGIKFNLLSIALYASVNQHSSLIIFKRAGYWS